MDSQSGAPDLSLVNGRACRGRPTSSRRRAPTPWAARANDAHVRLALEALAYMALSCALAPLTPRAATAFSSYLCILYTAGMSGRISVCARV